MALAILVPGTAQANEPSSGDPPAGADGSIYVVATSHLDTQWWWTIEETIRDLLPATFEGNFDLLDRYPGFRFGFEGAFRYMLLREYRPDLWARLKPYVEAGRWFPAGSALDAGDAIVPSPESMVRQFLYGNGFFRDELGLMSTDVFLPDCFGFPWALPSVAAHCGLKGFSTAKLDWGGALEIPFDVGIWEGPDGGSLVAALKPGPYNRELPGDPATLPETLDALDRQESASGLRFRYMYFGIGDRGGAVPEATVARVQEAMAGTGESRVVSASTEQMFLDLTEAEIAALPVFRGELLMRVHGTGTYTAQAAMKRWNRRNELLADAAERASTMAAWLGGRAYPMKALRQEWIRFLWHQFHDDLTGTSIPQAYAFSWNDLLLTQGRFANTLSGAVGTVARALDTRVEGVPVVVFNPLARPREDVVDAVLPWPEAGTPTVRVFDPAGNEVPSHATASLEDGILEVSFLASVQPNGFAVYDVRPAESPCTMDTGLVATDRVLKSDRYLVELDDNGDVSRILDLRHQQELLSAPLRYEFFDNLSIDWPAWEILWNDLTGGPREILAPPASFRVVEQGPVRACLEVERRLEESRFIQRTCLSAGDAGNRVDLDLDIDWATLRTLAKLAFPLAVSDDEATYDMGLGTIRRGVNSPELYEVPAQQWVDLTDQDGTYGVSISTDCKYGWDRPDSQTLRLTLLHTPLWPAFDQHTMDIGPHRVRVALFGHEGDWRNGAADSAARLNQPLAAFATSVHEGPLGRSWSFLALDRDTVDVRAIKAAESDTGLVVVRLQELAGRAADGVTISAGNGILEARRLDGMERDLGPLSVADGRAVIDLVAYGIATVGLHLAPPGNPLDDTGTGARVVDLPWDTDVVSLDEDRSDGAFDDAGRTYAGELWPGDWIHEGIPYRLGPASPGAANALTCAGQSLDLGGALAEGERIYLLVAATEAADATFDAGDDRFDVSVPPWTGFVGQWVDRVDESGSVIQDLAAFKAPYFQPDPVAWVGTHRHGSDGNHPYRFTYLFRKVLEAAPGTELLGLPDDPRIRVFAATVALDPADNTRPASRLFDGHDPFRAMGLHAPRSDEPPPVPDVSEGVPIPEDSWEVSAPDPGPLDPGKPSDAGIADEGPSGKGGSGGCSAPTGQGRDAAPGVTLLFLLLPAVLGLGVVSARRSSE
jgi:alpha-mannosidase